MERSPGVPAQPTWAGAGPRFQSFTPGCRFLPRTCGAGEAHSAFHKSLTAERPRASGSTSPAQGAPWAAAMTYFHFLGDLEVLVDNVLHLHHEHLTEGARGSFRRHLRKGPAAQLLLRLLLAPLRLPADLLLVFSFGLLGLYLQLFVDVNPEDGNGADVKLLGFPVLITEGCAGPRGWRPSCRLRTPRPATSHPPTGHTAGLLLPQPLCVPHQQPAVPHAPLKSARRANSSQRWGPSQAAGITKHSPALGLHLPRPRPGAHQTAAPSVVRTSVRGHLHREALPVHSM